MEVSNFEQLVKTICKADKEQVENLVKQYGDIRESHGIEQGWKRCRYIWGKAMRNRTERLRKHIINYDEYTGNIPTVYFIDFFAAVEEELKLQLKSAKDEGKKVAEAIHDVMWNSLGNIKIDKRRIIPFRNE